MRAHHRSYRRLSQAPIFVLVRMGHRLAVHPAHRLIHGLWLMAKMETSLEGHPAGLVPLYRPRCPARVWVNIPLPDSLRVCRLWEHGELIMSVSYFYLSSECILTSFESTRMVCLRLRLVGRVCTSTSRLLRGVCRLRVCHRIISRSTALRHKACLCRRISRLPLFRRPARQRSHTRHPSQHTRRHSRRTSLLPRLRPVRRIARV